MPYDSYVICTSPRSGSTLLCSLLAATGVAGRPASYFFDPSVAEWAADLGVTTAAGTAEQAVLDAVLGAVLQKGRAGTAVFGLRQQAHGLGFLCEKLAVVFPDATSDADRFRRAFGATLFIHLSRPDKIYQAVSWLKARQSGLWHLAADGSELERLAPHRAPAYDAPALRAAVAEMTAYDHGWTAWFRREAITPLRLSYDDLAADPLAVLRDVLGALGLDRAAADGVVPGVRKLADAVSRDWSARLRAGQD